MSCYKPLRGIKVLQPDGKFKVKIVGSAVRYADTMDIDALTFSGILNSATGELDTDVVQIPCGKCIGCRLQYSQEWADRITIESMMYPDSSWFITFTYDDEHLPFGSMLCNGDIFPSVNNDDVTRLLDAIRQKFHRLGHDGIRYYGAAEYGDKSMRPHYHFCFFNLLISEYDLKPYKRNIQGDQLYNVDWLADLWGKGFVVVGKLNWKTAAYTARYVLKKWKKAIDRLGFDPYEVLGIENQWSRMSRMPGIGKPYFDTHFEKIYTTDNITLPGGQIIQPPLYFDKLYKEIAPDHLEAIKLNRMINGAIQRDISLTRTDLSEADYFTLQESRKQTATKKLLRTL